MADELEYDDDAELELLAEVGDFTVFRGEDAEGEVIYNVGLATVTLHLLEEEWEDLVNLVRKAAKN